MSEASKIVDRMMEHDAFSQWLGIERIEEAPGQSILQMTVREEMLNGFGVAHGGITYSLADSALAFASNGHGRHALSIETIISHLAPVNAGDILKTDVVEQSLKHRIGVYEVRVMNQDDALVALFKGTVYRKGDWDVV
jgi:acyl-CoA thioesterase